MLFDWIYHWVTDGGHNDINVVLQAFSPEERERLIFLDGLTKSLGASNIRSAHLLAGKEVVKYIVSQASHGVIPSYFSQAVAIAAYEMGFENAAASDHRADEGEPPRAAAGRWKRKACTSSWATATTPSSTARRTSKRAD